MERLNLLKSFLERLDQLEAGNDSFSSTLRAISFAMKWSHQDLARLLDTSVPNIERWISGKVEPPAIKLVVKFLKEEVETKIKTLEHNDGN